jgi:hypothetical protein
VVTTAGAVAPLSSTRVPPPIGGPSDGLRVHLVDRGLEPVPVGVPGELCVAGAGLARGYPGRPGLTAGVFVPDPFAPPAGGAGERMYRTGDLARRLPDGRLDFLARTDHQVKVRGFRIEPGEIEARLGEHPAVRRAAVVAVEVAGRPAALAAFAVLEPEAAGAAGDDRGGAGYAAETCRELASRLAETLPAYMVPETVTALDELPLTPNGTVDRRALAALAARAAGGAGGAPGERVAPRDPGERLIAEIWAEVLGIEPAGRLGVHDDFFALGGHSLLVTRLAARVRDELGVDLAPRDFFAHPTIAGLSIALAQRLLEAVGDEDVAAAFADLDGAAP